MKVHGRPNQIRKKNKMTEKKAKKTIKLRDLEPTKDAIGGPPRRLLRQREDPRPAPRGGYGIHLVSIKG